jgi:UDP-N-acetylmuramate--alanine ligase
MRMDSRPFKPYRGLRIHFIGIGGWGMAGLAGVMLDAGAVVTGTDLAPSPSTRELSERGATVAYVQDGTLLAGGVDLVVRSAAVKDDNPEFQAAVRAGLPHLKYAQFLGQVMQHRLGIAVSGTHGKTTTTAMVAWALLQVGLDPSFVIGGLVKQLGGSSRSGGGAAFVVEACEFDRSFHNYFPRIAVITNIEEDHLDCYTRGLPEIIESFTVFAARVPADGLIVANGQDANTRQALRDLARPVAWVGLDSSAGLDWTACCDGADRGCCRGRIVHRGREVARIQLAVPGKHNLFNATAAIAACAAAGAEPQAAADALGRFRGADRRMTLLGQYNGASIIDDYGHHPTEVSTTLAALRGCYEPRRLICVFQPHQHSRTRELLERFAGSFVDADEVLLPDIYAARDTEADRRSVTSADLAERINRCGVKARHMPRHQDILKHLRTTLRPGEVVAFMGAGNIGTLGRELVGSPEPAPVVA